MVEFVKDQPVRVLVCGGRDFTDRIRAYQVLDDCPYKIVGIVHGAARGADLLAEDWAKERAVPYVGVPADWKQHGKRAGFIRNEAMLSSYGPDLVVAFPGGKGTAMMVKLAMDAGVPVFFG